MGEFNDDPEMLLLVIDLLKKERDAALERAEKAEGFIATHADCCFIRYVPLNNVFTCTVCQNYSNRARKHDAVVHEDDCFIAALLNPETTPATETGVKP